MNILHPNAAMHPARREVTGMWLTALTALAALLTAAALVAAGCPLLATRPAWSGASQPPPISMAPRLVHDDLRQHPRVELRRTLT